VEAVVLTLLLEVRGLEYLVVSKLKPVHPLNDKAKGDLLKSQPETDHSTVREETSTFVVVSVEEMLESRVVPEVMMTDRVEVYH
jgi:hypothetical protein